MSDSILSDTDFFAFEDDGVDSANSGGPGFVRAREALRGSLPDRALTNALNQGRLGGALLFYGPEGVGKWAAALGLAAALNCDSRDETSALGGTHAWNPAARYIFAGTFPELHWAAPQPTPKESSAKREAEEIELAQEFFQQKRIDPYRIVRWSRPAGISIERSRRIKRNLTQTPAPGAIRVVIFYQIEKMKPEALDSLLKMIEEPPPRTVFILISDQPESASPTALSRCHRVRFPALSKEKLNDYLASATTLTPQRRQIVASLAAGSPGRALELADEMSSEGGEDISSREVSWLTFKALLLEPGPVALEALFNAVDLRNRGAVSTLVGRWRGYVRDLILLSHKLEAEITNVDLTLELGRLSGAVPGRDQLAGLSDHFTALEVNLRHNVSAPLALTGLSFAIRRAFGKQ